LLHDEIGVAFTEDVIVVIAFTALEMWHIFNDSKNPHS
jgi:hypothetical protein